MRLLDDTATAFATKTDAELERAYFLFRLIANQPFVRIGQLVTTLALKTHLPVEGLIRSTVFDHFCAGTTVEESTKVVEKLAQKQVFSVLDYSVEGAKEEVSLDECYHEIIKTITFSGSHPYIPFTVFKPTGFGRFSLYEKVSQNQSLTPSEEAEWSRVRQRFVGCCEAAKKHQMKLLIDAEESWIQPAINTIVEELMRTYNRKEPLVYTTAQMYLSEKLSYLKHLATEAKKDGFVAGIKLVRGAYMEKENERAATMGYASPLCASKTQTDENFDAAWQFILNHFDIFALYFGSHNEDSTYALIDAMEERKIPYHHPHLWFGQLYGMSDHISFNLAKAGFRVSKYLPFGPVRDVLPYLIRRAEENTAVGGQSIRELVLIKKERKRRKLQE